MEFTLGPTQQAAAEAAAHVLDRYQPGPETGRDECYDRALWKELAQAGLLGLAVPAWLGGEGLGVLDVAVLLTGVGRTAAPVPALATLAMSVLPVARWGSREQQQALLTGVAGGDVVHTAAVREPSEPAPDVPVTTAALGGTPGAGTVSGVKTGVPYAAAADWILVPARLSTGGTGIAVVDPAIAGVSLRRTPAAAGAPEYTVRLAMATSAICWATAWNVASGRPNCSRTATCAVVSASAAASAPSARQQAPTAVSR